MILRVGQRHLSICPEGADGTNFSFQHSARSTSFMGPKHDLKTHCFAEGEQYIFDAKIKLLNESDDPFECDKSHKWDDEKPCPILAFQLVGESGESWKYYGNHFQESWVADQWNPFNTRFFITDEIEDATDEFFILRGLVLESL